MKRLKKAIETIKLYHGTYLKYIPQMLKDDALHPGSETSMMNFDYKDHYDAS